MKTSILRLATIGVLLVGALGSQTVGALGKAPATSNGRAHVRIAPPHVAQFVRSSVPTKRALGRSNVLVPNLVSTTAPALPKTPSRNRTLPSPVPALSNPYAVSAQQVLIDQDRATNGNLPPLLWSSCLANIALQNAQRIAAQGYLSHTNGPTLDLGCASTLSIAGENIAYWSAGINDPQANTMFMNSAPHRANILNSAYRYVGTAWVVASNGYGYLAVEFAG